MISPIIYHYSRNIYGMASISFPEVFKRFAQQGKADRCEILRPNGNEDVAGRLICDVGQNRLGRGAVDQHEILVLKMVGDESG